MASPTSEPNEVTTLRAISFESQLRFYPISPQNVEGAIGGSALDDHESRTRYIIRRFRQESNELPGASQFNRGHVANEMLAT